MKDRKEQTTSLEHLLLLFSNHCYMLLFIMGSEETKESPVWLSYYRG
jgi:hypothetical protein